MQNPLNKLKYLRKQNSEKNEKPNSESSPLRRLLNNKKGVAISNIFAAITSFFIGLVMVLTLGPVITIMLSLFTDTLMRMIFTTAYVLLALLLAIYFPIKMLNSPDEAKEIVKTLILTPEKMVKWQYGTKKDDRLQCWIAYENETIPYPSNVKIDSGIVATFIEQIILNFRMLDTEASSKWAWLTKLLPWLAGIAILGYIAYTFGWLDSFFVVASNTTNTTNRTLPANITQIVGNGVQVI